MLLAAAASEVLLQAPMVYAAPPGVNENHDHLKSVTHQIAK